MFKKNKKKNVNEEKLDINIVDDNKEVKKNSFAATFISLFIKKMREDKLYFLSFLITLVFLVFFSVYNIYKAEGLYSVDNEKVIDEEVKDVTDELDVSDYVGIYSKEYKLDKSLLYNGKCSIDQYKIVYSIKSDKKIMKYFINDCVGTVLMWSDSLSYLDNGEAKYVSANGQNYLFSASAMKELDGDTYLLDSSIKTLKHNQKYGSSNILFDSGNIIFISANDLVLIKNNSIEYKLSDNYELNTKYLDKLVYESSKDDYKFKFIVPNKNVDALCYQEDYINSESFVDGDTYKVYSINYNSDKQKFDDVKEISSRKKSDSCTVFDKDLEGLNS